jgi:DNA-binding CsgD family transcriptional regulator
LWVTLHVLAELDEALALGGVMLDAPLSPSLRSEVSAQVALAYGDHGAPDAARAVLDSARADSSELARWCDAELDALLGDHDAAYRKAAAVAASSRRWPVPALASVTAAWAATNGGCGFDTRHGLDGAAAVELSALALGTADPGAATIFRDAAARWETLSRRSVLRCRMAAALAFAACDRPAALAELRGVREEADASGMAVLAAQVDRARRRLGDPDARVGASGPRGSVLSRREAEVMSLVADGLTSVSIAARLNVAPSTVETHVKSAMRKLGAGTRTEAAVLATKVSS